MLTLGCTLSDLANICPHKSKEIKFYLLTAAVKNLFEKIREDIVGEHSIAFSHKAVVV